ncbi:hypothetical protein TNCV_4200911 [Trichonephila clavipes]|uniref:Uncharacterized protein n=1 Tax=Trichonephila clavipes TaxID=2585209 RepID=A0A8X6WBZ7_TRICX|nr:hypothetical protein TNCV_4200911 [Trichonephila clavipes]
MTHSPGSRTFSSGLFSAEKKGRDFVRPDVGSRDSGFKGLISPGVAPVDVTNPEFHLPSKVIFTGAEASTLLKKLSKNHPIAKEFQISLMKAYTNTAQHMKQKLPLKNSYLISFTALDPELREAEIRLYQSDIDITKEMLYTSDESGNQVKCTIDKYWSKVFNLKDDFTNDYKYPALAKLVKACLSCFHGPLVKSAFNLMDTLVTDYRTSLKIDSLDAVQTIK